MFQTQTDLLITVLAGVLGPLPAFPNAPKREWADAKAALALCGDVEPDLASAISSEDREALKSIVEQWSSGKRYLVSHDREILKQAMKAFRKRLKATLLDAESSLGGGAMTAGRKSSIVGIRPHERFPQHVWDELVRQKRLIAGRDGTYELAPEGGD